MNVVLWMATIVLALLATFVTWGRFGAYPV